MNSLLCATVGIALGGACELQNDIEGDALYRKAVLLYEKAYELNLEKAPDRATLKHLQKSYHLMHQVLDEHPNSRSAYKVISDDAFSINLAKVVAKIQALQPEFLPEPVQEPAGRKKEAPTFLGINPLIKISSFIKQARLPSMDTLKNLLAVKKNQQNEELSPLSKAATLAVNDIPANNRLSRPVSAPELEKLAEPLPPMKKLKIAVAAVNTTVTSPQKLPIKKPVFDSKVAEKNTEDAEMSKESDSNTIVKDETVKLAGNDANESAQKIAEKLIAAEQALEPINTNVTKTKKQNYTSDIDSPATRTQKRFIPFLRVGYLHSLNVDAKKWFDECDTTCSDQWVSAGSSKMPSYNGQSIQLGLLSHSYYLSLGLEKQNNQTHIIRDITDRSGGRTWVLESDFNTSITFLELGKEWPIKNTKGLVTTFITGGEARRRLTRIYGNDAAGPWEGYTNIKSSQKMWRVGSGYAYTINNNWRIDGRLQYSNYGRVVLSNEDGGAATGRYIKAVEANIGLTYLFDQ